VLNTLRFRLFSLFSSFCEETSAGLGCTGRHHGRPWCCPDVVLEGPMGAGHALLVSVTGLNGDASGSTPRRRR